MAAKKTAAKRKPSAAFMKPVQPNEKLALVVGSKPLPRTELTKKALGVHQEEWVAGQESPHQHQCR